MRRLSAGIIATLAAAQLLAAQGQVFAAQGKLTASPTELAQVAQTRWEVVSSEVDQGAASGIEHRHVELAKGGDRATIDVALFSAKSASLRVIDDPEGSDRLAEAMQRANCVAGVNGGYFDTTFKPIGLRVVDGAVTSPLVRARLLTGVLCDSGRGIEIKRLAEFSPQRKLNAALECGPLLVDGGKAVSKLDATRSARRTFAAITRGGKAALGVSSDLTLAQLAELLGNDRSMANDFKIWRAMNLDGGSSSAFWFKKADGGIFAISEDKAVRDFVGVASK